MARNLTSKQVRFLFASGSLSRNDKNAKVQYNLKRAKEISSERAVGRFGSEGTGQMARSTAVRDFPKGTKIIVDSWKGKSAFVVSGYGNKGLSQSRKEQGIVNPILKQVSGKTDKTVTSLGDIGFDVAIGRSLNQSPKVRIQKPK